MSEIKALNKILASSKDNFIVFSNEYAQEKPYITFQVSSGFTSQSHPTITLTDRVDEGNFKRVLEGVSGGTITVTSFGFFSDALSTAFSLMECLKKNDIFHNVEFTTGASNTYIVKAELDTSISYNIYCNDNHIVVGGNYIGYSADSPDKFVLLAKADIDNSTTQISMEKVTNGSLISFNVTSPFQGLTLKNPVNVSLLGYEIHNNKPEILPISNQSFYVLPTTLSKFQEIDYNNYFYNSTIKDKKQFLTNRKYRTYNYGETISLSFLSDIPCSLLTNYYTNGGSFITSSTWCDYSERNGIRTDYYTSFDIETVEDAYSGQVGYFEVVAMNGGDVASNPVRFKVVPKCNENREIFFVNEIGGIDSFNFLGEYVYNSEIDDLETYRINPTDDFGDVKVITSQRTKRNPVTHTLTTGLISMEDAKWLDELGKSKYIFKYSTSGSRYQIVIPEDMDIELSDRDDSYEVTFEYRDSDNFLLI